jgi:WD40 repeat protein
MSGLRIALIVVAFLTAAWWGFACLASFPIIVIADSDLGAGAMKRVQDAAVLSLSSLAAAVVLCIRFGERTLLIGLSVLVSCISFESSDFSHKARWSVLAICGLAIAATHVEGRSLRLWRVGLLALLTPALLLLTDYHWRVLAGRMPSSWGALAKRDSEAWRTSVSLLDLQARAQAISPQSGLRATAGKDGILSLQNIAGGPPLLIPPSGNDRRLDVLTFSPDGRTLAVADNDCMYTGSVITLWDVAPGDPQTPPRAVLRHILHGHTHYTFSLDFFPDGRTLISANGDGTVRLWDTVQGKETRCLQQDADCVVTAPDGRAFAAWGRDGITIRDRDSLQALRLLDARGIASRLAFSPDGNSLLATDREGIAVWDTHFRLDRLLAALVTTAAIVLGLVLVSRTASVGARGCHR